MSETFAFSPPTYDVEVPRRLTGGPRYRLTESQSVVRINGTLAVVKTPSSAQLVAAGTEGQDYFLGGRIYVVPQPVADELTAAGYELGLGLVGYGLAGYGEHSYGG